MYWIERRPGSWPLPREPGAITVVALAHRASAPGPRPGMLLVG